MPLRPSVISAANHLSAQLKLTNLIQWFRAGGLHLSRSERSSAHLLLRDEHTRQSSNQQTPLP